MTENARGRESAQIHVFSGSLLKRERERGKTKCENLQKIWEF